MREKSNDITFINDTEIEYTRDFKVSSLIKNVEGYSIDEFNINKDDTVLTLPNGKTVMINYNKKEIKLDTIEFSFKYKDSIYKKKILIKDTSAPVIQCLSTYDVEKGNKYFDLKNLITYSDNYYSTNEIELYYNGTYNIDKVGQYKVEIIAQDKNKNKSSKTVVINVKDDDVNDNYISSNTSSKKETNSNNSSSNNKSNSSESKSSSSGNNKSNFTPKSKLFTIDTYDSFEQCLNECQAYIDECINKGYKGKAQAKPIKRDGVYYGYQAIFY